MKKSVLFLLCLLYCPPLFADRISDLEEQVAIQQEQILELQCQMQRLMADKGERPILEHSESRSIDSYEKEPRISFKLKPGWASLSYQVGTPSRLNTAGFAMSGEADVNLTKRTSLNLTADAFISDEGAKHSFGTQIVDISADAQLYTLSPNARYRVLDSSRNSVDLSLGYELLIQGFREGPMATKGGHGPRIGIIANYYPIEKLSFTTEGFYTSFFDVFGETKYRTEGYAFRFDIGGRYRVYDRFELGTGYRGYLLSLDPATSRRGSDAESTRIDHLYGYLGYSF